MDKGLTRYLRGRGRIALAVAVSLVLVLALPTLAFAVTWGAPFPTGTLHTTAQLVGVNAFSSTALDVRTASITIDGVSQAVAVNVAGASTGDWAITEIGPADDGSYRIRWTWTAAVADTTKVSLSCAPAGSAATTGTHNVVASIGGVSTPWTYVVARTTPAPIPPSSVTATTVAGCECHPGFQTSHHHGDAVCADCHTGVNAPAHGDPYGSFTHVILPTASMDTTNQACVASGCHSRDLVTAHNNASCWSSSCHASYDVGPGQPGCPCHGAAKGRPTGDLAHNMSAATLNNGATLQCTTCHNTPNHMGHTPVNYYGAGQRAGEPPLHRAITAATVDSQNQGCINCHGVGGSVDLALVHWNGKSKLSGCFCHDAANYTNNAVTSSGQTFKFVIDAGRNGSPVYCTDCHSWADVQDNHGAATTPPVHAAIAPPSSDTTDTACVSSGCHSSDLVTAHNNSSCWSASCHVSYGSALVPPVPAACPCHGAAAGRPTGDLALNMKNATISGGAGLVCTTCHNTPNHMGHEPANYYYPGSRAGEPALHAAITTLTVNASSAGCVQCHGNGDGTADLALVHWNGGEALGGCFCHANSAYAAEIASGVGGAHVSCTDAGCHDLPTVNIKHGNQSASAVTHTIMVTASMDTTNQACVASGCHDTGLVAVHNNSACASCHGAAPYNTTPNACFCHEAAAGRPTGDLATNMLNGLNSVNSAGGLGSTVECTTCHNTPNHMGHTPVNYYGPGQRQGEPPLHVAITTVTLSGDTTNTACVGCHGISGSADLAMVHKGLNGCFCHAGTTYATQIASGRGGTPVKCTDCHHGSDAAHVVGGVGDTHPTAAPAMSTSAGCGACHGGDVLNVAASDDYGRIVGEHQGCSCHAYAASEPDLAAVISAGLAGHPAECVDCHANPMVNVGPYPYHVGAHNTLQGEIAANSAGCVSCHASNLMAVLPAGWDGASAASEHQGCSCHAYGEATADTTACEDCHTKPMDPSAPYPYHVGAHDSVQAGIAGTASSSCVACHSTNLLNVTAGPMTATAHQGCLCHARGVATGATECVSCHTGADAAHGFENGVGHTGEGGTPVSGHNTTTYGAIGARISFPTLTWESEVASDSLSPAYQTALGVSSLTVGQEGSVQTQWQLPTVGVFWPADDPQAPTTARTGLGWGDTITCQDCHTGLSAAGPHGAAQNWGLDPNYPGDYSYAELTKYITANLAYPTTNAAYNSPLSMSGIAMFPGAATHADITTTSVNVIPAGATSAVANRTDGTTGATAVICAKCHKLEVLLSGTNTVLAANTAHSSHHQDNADGSAQCVNCHVGLPHGWKRPRLLVDSDVDLPPYLDPQHLGTTSPAENGYSIRPFGSGFGAGFNGETMQTLSATDQHTLDANGAAAWNVEDCDACGTISHAHPGDEVAKIKME